MAPTFKLPSPPVFTDSQLAPQLGINWALDLNPYSLTQIPYTAQAVLDPIGSSELLHIPVGPLYPTYRHLKGLIRPFKGPYKAL